MVLVGFFRTFLASACFVCVKLDLYITVTPLFFFRGEDRGPHGKGLLT